MNVTLAPTAATYDYNPDALFPTSGVADNDTNKSSSNRYVDVFSIKIEIFLALRILISVLGWIGNVLNIRTFLKIGLVDSVTVVFFNIAVADLNLIHVVFVKILVKLLEYVPEDVFYSFKVHPFAVESINENIIEEIFILVTVHFTTFIAVQRCLCVIKPLHFSGIFTRFRTIIVILLIWGFSLSINLSCLAFVGVNDQTLPYNNNSWVTMYYTPQWHDYIHDLEIALSVSNALCQFVVLVCIVVMAGALKRSVRFRQQNISTIVMGRDSPSVKSSKAETSDKKTSCRKDAIGKSKEKQVIVHRKDANGKSKERQVIVQVSLVAAIFILTHFHRLVFEVLWMFPEVKQYLIHGNEERYDIYFKTANILYLLNASVNFLIFYKFNTKFRSLCFKWSH